MGPLTLAATCAGIAPQESFVKSVGQVTCSTQTDGPTVNPRKTYVAILKSVPTKGESRTAPSVANISVTEPLKIIKSPKNLPIAPRPDRSSVTKATIISDDENEDKPQEVFTNAQQKTSSSPQKIIATNQKVISVPQKSTFTPKKLASAPRKSVQTPHTVVRVPEKDFHRSPVTTTRKRIQSPQKGIQQKRVPTIQKCNSAPKETFTIEKIVSVPEEDFPESPIITPDPFDSPLDHKMDNCIPPIEDITPSLGDDLDFNWDDFLQPPPHLSGADFPMSLGSPDSGIGSDIIASDIISKEEPLSTSPFGDDVFLDSLISQSDSNLVTLPPHPEDLEFDADKFLSEFLTF